jgi:hypothetical protein
LAATGLAFDHPHTGSRIELAAPLEAGFLDAARRLGWPESLLQNAPE